MSEPTDAMPKTRMNPVGTTPNTQRVADGIHEVPCSVNPVALLRVSGLAEKYLKEHPDDVKGFQEDLDACNRAGEIYNLLWEEVNRKKHRDILVDPNPRRSLDKE